MVPASGPLAVHNPGVEHDLQDLRSLVVDFRVVGDARSMRPIVRDEIYRIGYRAIRNACVHSEASKLEVEFTYGQDLAPRVADNGVGIGSAVADRGKDGHFGLQGMRELPLAFETNSPLAHVLQLQEQRSHLSCPSGIVFQKTRAARLPPLS
jgi:glucose-6-phosphate-specific signal transduction histidine kinase